MTRCPVYKWWIMTSDSVTVIEREASILILKEFFAKPITRERGLQRPDVNHSANSVMSETILYLSITCDLEIFFEGEMCL